MRQVKPYVKIFLMINKSLLYIFLALLCGCSWISKKPIVPKPIPKKLTENRVDQESLRTGTYLAVTAFKAGPGVEANAELDKISSYIIKGIIDILTEKQSRLRVLVASEATTADFVIEGHITNLDKRNKFRSWILRSNKIELGIKAQLFDSKTGQKVLIFKHKQQRKEKNETHKDLGYRLGRTLGAFIAENSL